MNLLLLTTYTKITTKIYTFISTDENKYFIFQGFGPDHVISKFKNLRSSYCQELKKIAASEKSGTSVEDIYVPHVIWFSKMNSFLKPYVTMRETCSNYVSIFKMYI